jgi:hypothetical protein
VGEVVPVTVAFAGQACTGRWWRCWRGEVVVVEMLAVDPLWLLSIFLDFNSRWVEFRFYPPALGAGSALPS